MKRHIQEFGIKYESEMKNQGQNLSMAQKENE